MARFRQGLTVVDRSMIELRLQDGWGIRAIARLLGRSAGTVSDEIARHGGCAGYRAQATDTRAACRRRSGRKPRLAPDGPLFAEIARLLRLGWSPEQIAGRRRRGRGDMVQHSGLLVSHEAIYTALRQHFPKGMNLNGLTQTGLDAVAARLNSRPR